VLADLGANVTHLGPLGAGQTAKILNQAIVGVGHVLMAETLALARAAGLAPEKLPASLAGGYADSVMLQRLFPRMCAGAFEPPSGYARQLLKDLKNVVGFAHDLDLALPVLEQAFAQYKAHVDAGNAMRDSASIAEFYAREGAKAGHG
jgi:3-hydroxyisobutyrate dehydrogenase